MRRQAARAAALLLCLALSDASYVQLDVCNIQGSEAAPSIAFHYDQASGLCTLSALAITSDASSSACPASPEAAPRFSFSLPCTRQQEGRVEGSLKGPSMALYTQMQRRLQAEENGMSHACSLVTRLPNLYYKMRRGPVKPGILVQGLPCTAEPAGVTSGPLPGSLAMHGLHVAITKAADGGAATCKLLLGEGPGGVVYVSSASYSCQEVAEPSAAYGAGSACCMTD